MQLTPPVAAQRAYASIDMRPVIAAIRRGHDLGRFGEDVVYERVAALWGGGADKHGAFPVQEEEVLAALPGRWKAAIAYAQAPGGLWAAASQARWPGGGHSTPLSMFQGVAYPSRGDARSAMAIDLVGIFQMHVVDRMDLEPRLRSVGRRVVELVELVVAQASRVEPEPAEQLALF